MPLKIDSSLDLNSTIDAVCTLAYHIRTFPLLRDFYLPKRYLSKHLDFDKGPFTINDTLSKICAHWCISLLIEKPKGYEFYKGVYENNNDILYDVPMSFFTKKKSMIGISHVTFCTTSLICFSTVTLYVYKVVGPILTT